MNDDSQTLLALDGGAWAVKLGWSEEATNISTWVGVKVVDGRVTKLELPWKRVEGSIPKELGELYELQSLSLEYNHLTGSIPPELGQLKNLKSLSLVRNQLTGRIPKELEQLQNLEKLVLWGNQLTGSIPKELGQLQNLKKLGLGGNQFTGEIPKELGNLSSLKELHLDKNKLTGSIPKELGNLTALTHLYLSRNQLTGSIPPELGHLKTLLGLKLLYNQLTGSIPKELGQLQSLEKLDLSRNKLEGSTPHELGQLEKLESLDLSHNQLTGSVPKELGQLRNLRELNLRYNELTGFSREAARALCQVTQTECDFYLDGNPWDISAAVVTLGPAAVLDYHNSLWSCRGLLRETQLKVVLLGEPASGKTSVTRYLRDSEEPPLPGDQAYWETIGVSMHSVVLEPGNKNAMEAALWDVGGQTSYYGFHHLLLTNSTVYLLVADITQLPSTAANEGNPGWRRVDAWLDSILQRTQGSALVVVATHMDQITADREIVKSRLKALGCRVVNHVYAASGDVESALGAEILGLVATGLNREGKDFSAPEERIEFTYKDHYGTPDCNVSWRYGKQELRKLLCLDSIEEFKSGKKLHLVSAGRCEVPRGWRRCLRAMEAYRDGTDCARAANRLDERLTRRPENARQLIVPWTKAARVWVNVAGPPWRRALWCLWNPCGDATLEDTLAAAMAFYASTGKVLITGAPAATAATAGAATARALAGDQRLLHLELRGLGELMRRLADHSLAEQLPGGHDTLQRHHSDFVRFGLLDEKYLREYLWSGAYRCADAPDERVLADLFSETGCMLQNNVFESCVRSMRDAEVIFINPNRARASADSTAPAAPTAQPVYEYLVASRLPELCLSNVSQLADRITDPEVGWECLSQTLFYVSSPLSTLSLSLLPRFFARCSRAICSSEDMVLWQHGGYFTCTDDASVWGSGAPEAQVLVLEEHVDLQALEQHVYSGVPKQYADSRKAQVRVYVKAVSGKCKSAVWHYCGLLMGSTSPQILADRGLDPVKIYRGDDHLTWLMSKHEATMTNYFDQRLHLQEERWQQLADRLASEGSIAALDRQLKDLSRQNRDQYADVSDQLNQLATGTAAIQDKVQHLVGGLYPSRAVLLPEWDGVEGTTVGTQPWWQKEFERKDMSKKKKTPVQKPMRLVLICDRDNSLVPCGSGGKGYEVWTVRERIHRVATAAKCAIVCIGAGAAAAAGGGAGAVVLPALAAATDAAVKKVVDMCVEEVAAAADAVDEMCGAQLVTLDQDLYDGIRHGRNGEDGCPYQPLVGDRQVQLWRLIRILEEVHRRDPSFVSFTQVMEHDVNHRAARWVKK